MKSEHVTRDDCNKAIMSLSVWTKVDFVLFSINSVLY